MKKGCFVKIIIVLTVIVAAALFLIQNYGDELIFKPGEKFIKSLVFKDVTKQLEYVRETPEKDSLKALLDNFIHARVRNKEEIKINSEEIESLVDSVEIFLKDSLITDNEIEKVKRLFDNLNE